MHWLNIQSWIKKGNSPSMSMGCTPSKGWKKKKNIPEITIFVPQLWVPVRIDDSQKILKSSVSTDFVDKLSCLRNQIVFVAENTGGSAIHELQRALEEYLSLLVGLNKKECGVQEPLEFKWKNLADGQEVSVQNWWFEVLSVIHMMATLTLTEANSMLIPKVHDTTQHRIVSSDSMRNAVDLLLKAAGHLDLLIRDVLVHFPPDARSRLPIDFHEGILEAISIQALAQGTEMQLSLAVESKNATLSVKRRLACEQLSYLGQAHRCLLTSNNNQRYGKKHMLFIKWKYLEAKAAAYYYNGLILDKGTEPSAHISAVCCLLAAEDILAESKKANLSFCLAVPVTRPPPIWGAMKTLNKKIPEIASRMSQMYGYLMDQDKALQNLPELPEFQLSLLPEDYQLPESYSARSMVYQKPDNHSANLQGTTCR